MSNANVKLKSNFKEHPIHSNLFGIRKPMSIFQDNDYKHRIMMDEMIADQFLSAAAARGSSEAPGAGAQSPPRNRELQVLTEEASPGPSP